MDPSTVVQPLTLKLKLKAPPLPARFNVLLVIEPIEDPVPSFTAPPAWYALTIVLVGKFVLPTHGVEDPVVVVLLPAVSEAKSSRKTMGIMVKFDDVVALP
jgi:hypothetical protein